MMIATLTALALIGLADENIGVKFIAEGVTDKVGGYRPMRAVMDGTADLAKKPPADLTAPKYGKLTLGDRHWAFIVDEPKDKPAKLYVDSNGDGNFTNDPPASWTPKTNDGLTMHMGDAQLDLGGGNVGKISLYRFDPKDPRRSQLKNTLLFYTDFGSELSLKLDGKIFSAFVAGDLEPEGSFQIDRDGNKKLSFKSETIAIGKPFNFTGTTYLITVDKGKPKIQKAEKPLPLAPLPVDLSIGKTVPTFQMSALDGSEIDFPKSYKGKIVMLDFWATWCGPCLAELPNVKKAYETHHDKGFDVLGVSFDEPKMTEKLKEFTKKNGMLWKHIYEGKGWETKLGEMFEVEGIPFVLLIDGDTGEILASERQLRGPGLTDVIGKALAKKKPDTK